MPVSSHPTIDETTLAAVRRDEMSTRRELLDALRALEADLRRTEDAAAASLRQLHPRHRPSGYNLLQYLALRHRDVRALQAGLARLGLSSLGRSEAHVLRTVGQVRAVLETLVGVDPPPVAVPVGFGEGSSLLEANTDALLGPPPSTRRNRIMVTLPSEAAGDPALVAAMVREGMDCARINAAHDGPEAWAAMAANVRRAAAEVGRICVVQIDLAGPKLRTGPLPAGPGVLRLRPLRNELGQVIAPARAWLGTADQSPAAPCSVIPVPEDWAKELRPGTRIHLRDARGARRTLLVTESLPDGAWAETRRTAYLTTGTPLRVDGEDRAVEVGALPGIERPLVVRPGDTIVLTADLSASPVGEGDRRRIGCTLPEVFDRVRVGDPIWFDDGRIGGVVTAVHPGEADVEVRSASPGGTKLRAEKGINLPDTDLGLGALTPDDTEALAFAAAHADLIALSFVQRPEDIELLQRELSARGGSDIGVILKIETKQGFARLPELLLAAMATERVGVMIARGDLAVECGFERLAEVQEEILWLCEAAHVPVIWATQVLDQLARTGQPSRAEITDAAMSERAECVMLNKGPHILEAIAVLDDILRRMSGHQQKKVPLLRQLRAWDPPVG